MHFIVDIFTTMLYNLHVVILMNKTILPIGKTPMVQIEYKYKGKIKYFYAKLEYYNLTGSIIGAKEEDFEMLAQKAMEDPCKPGNPRDVSKEEFIELFRKAM